MNTKIKYKKYLPHETYEILRKWYNRFSLKDKYESFYIKIHIEIQKGNDSYLSPEEQEMLSNLFSTQIINRQNILYYYQNFPMIISEKIIMKNIERFLETFDFKKADSEFEKYKDGLAKNQYAELKNKYIAKQFQMLKEKVLHIIEIYLSKYDFIKADAEYALNQDKIPEKEYLYLKQKYLQGYRKKIISKITDFLKDYDFAKADAAYQKTKDIINKKEYLALKDRFIEEMKKFLWNKIRFSLNNFDYADADRIFKDNNIYINAEEYFEQRAFYVKAEKVWNRVIHNLKNYNFKIADSLTENPSFREFFKRMKYDGLRGQYVQEYFNKYFDEDGKPFTLDTEQCQAVAHNGANLLVSARAGSGKTRVIVAKLLYLLENQKVPWDSIYVLAFNKNVPLEILERIQQKVTLKHNPKKYSKLNVAHTFHKLAYSWAAHKGKVLADNKKHFIKLIIEYLKETDAQFKRKVYDFFRKESMTVKKEQFADPQDYYEHTRNKRDRALKGHNVKSTGEKWIADFLFEHGIDYRYEYSFFTSYIKDDDINADGDFRSRCMDFLKKSTHEIKPDFYLTEYNIVWEHWGIDVKSDSEETKAEFEKVFGSTWEEYKEKMDWKKGFWKPWRKVLTSDHWAVKSIREVNKLIETSVGDLNCSREEFELKLKKILSAENIEVKKRSKDELIQDVWDKAIDRFATMIESFINRYQQQYYDSYDTFCKNIENYKENDRVYAFLQLGLRVLNFYEKALSEENKIEKLNEYEQYNIDFNQLLLEAIKKIDAGQLDEDIKKMRYILIDEYQDFSLLFFNLINAIRKRNPFVCFFCVGDGWQAINRFAGSDTKYFNSFKSYFKDGDITELTTNYRSSKTIINASNKFMKDSGFQGSPANAFRGGDSSDIEVNYVDGIFVEFREQKNDTDEDAFWDQIIINKFIKSDGEKENNWKLKSKYLKRCIGIIEDNPGKEILILHRNNDFMYQLDLKLFSKKLCNVLLQKKIVQSKEEYKKIISVRTMHAAKGLEADVVILLEINRGLIPMYHPDNELFEIFGEDVNVNSEDQKRLFYVSVTRAKEKLYILCEKDKQSDFIKKLLS